MIFTLVEAVRMALSSLVANKLRSFLTMLGVIIGVMAVVALVSIGQGASRSVTDQIAGLGSNAMFISPGRKEVAPGIWRSAGNLEMEHLEALRQADLPGVVAVSGQIETLGAVHWGRQSTMIPLVGTTPEWSHVVNWPVTQGRFLSLEDLERGRPVVALGPEAARQIFGDSGVDPVGQVVSIGSNRFTVIGVMGAKDSAFIRGLDRLAMIPLTTARSRITGQQQPLSDIVVSASAAQTSLAEAALRNYLAQLLGGPEAFRIDTQQQILDVVNQTTGVLTLLLAGITGISLLVGGIGIMNIMLVSVTERTREIGVRKALGAKSRYVLMQFVVESVALSGVGGLVGMAVGTLLTWVAARLGHWPFTVQPATLGLAFGFSAAVGLFFGIWPARRAARLDPIEALRYE
ncbi:ABC transporter permease [Limnochorda pilosa]|uniref:ABC transporter permease n=1 Tax=Limnochorda pilosa TaxID=1555112 RepID=A0A0K2SNK7_LIMPI|nr:ABC transporter permease [Limnochorda pilosa]BAS28713.1 ABC transporter permease [Limnochorda pilosa]